MRVINANFVNNSGPNTVESVFKELAHSAKTLQAVVAFVTKAGVDAVLPHVRTIAERGQVHITVGLYQGITEPSALRALAKAAKVMNGRLTIRISRVPNLHRKVYVFGFAKQTALLVGSSNLSTEGLWSEGEFNVLLRLPTSAKLAAYLPELANDGKMAVPLTPQLISDYELSRHRPKPGVEKAALHKVLNTKWNSLKLPPRLPLEVKWVRHGITGYTRAQTGRTVEQQTGWDQRGWDWCTVKSEDRVSIGDRVLLFDYSGEVAWAYIVVVKGVTRTAVRTPDGRCFFAHAEARRQFRRKKVTKTLLGNLAAAGLDLTKQASQEESRRLSKRAIAAVNDVFKR